MVFQDVTRRLVLSLVVSQLGPARAVGYGPNPQGGSAESRATTIALRDSGKHLRDLFRAERRSTEPDVVS